jgi:uncharacterized protein with von Willebrand factor type A (vWA) domain
VDNFLLSNLLLFARLLRALGFTISPEQVSDLARVLEKIGVTRRENVYYAARALLVTKQSELALFDRAFNLFFAMQGKPQQSVIDATHAPAKRVLRPKTIQQLAEQARTNVPRAGQGNAPESEEIPFYSAAETLRTKRFDQFNAEELRAARQIIAQMQWRAGMRKTRRYERIARGARLDLSRVLRRNLKHGAEVYELPARERKFKPRPLIVLADISGSMERYSRMVLQLIHALGYTDLAARVEAFVFSTRLTRITPDLKRRSVDAALARVSTRVQDFGGGTRIGDALKTFNYQWARRVLRHGAVVLIISDGWDCGDLDLLRREMARLQKSCSRLIWLNPLLGHAAFRPDAQGLQVALPYVDEHLPVHNLENLEQLVTALRRVGATRPRRRQMPRVEIPRAEKTMPKVMDLPQQATSDYERKTMVLRVINGVPTFVYEENPSKIF